MMMMWRMNGWMEAMPDDDDDDYWGGELQRAFRRRIKCVGVRHKFTSVLAINREPNWDRFVCASAYKYYRWGRARKCPATKCRVVPRTRSKWICGDWLEEERRCRSRLIASRQCNDVDDHGILFKGRLRLTHAILLLLSWSDWLRNLVTVIVDSLGGHLMVKSWMTCSTIISEGIYLDRCNIVHIDRIPVSRLISLPFIESDRDYSFGL